MIRRPDLALTLTLCATACGWAENDAPMCNPAMPPARQLRADPALQSLQYYTRANYDQTRGTGSDVWADAKFTFAAALNYVLTPYSASTSEGAQYCAKGITLQLAWPLDDARRKMLAAFISQLAGPANADGKALQETIGTMIDKEEPFRTVTAQGPLTIEAGRLSHPGRGDFFAVGFLWGKR